jgi:hypothetical protein
MTAGGASERSEGSEGIEGVEEVVDELLAIPPERFTEERNAAVKRLRAEGQRAAAEAIKGLPRPPVSLWALNRLAREQPSLIETFLRSAEQLRQAYRSGGDIRAASSPERAAEARVVAAAAELARAEGRNVTETVVDRLQQSMRAAAADPEIAAALRDGRLLREPAAPSLEELLGSLPQASEAPRTKAPQQRDHERLALREQVADAKSDASRARSEARAASDVARKAQREWERAKKLAEQAERRSDAAAERLRDLQQRLEEL